MRKGNLNINYAFLASVAFILAILGQTLLCGVLLGVVMIVEKDAWLTRQSIQAFCLCFISSIVYNVLDIFSFLYKIPLIGSLLSGGISLVNALVRLLILIFAVVAIAKVSKEQEANVPVLDKFAEWAVK